MSSENPLNTPVSRAALDRVFEASPPHIRPIIEAVRDRRCGSLWIAPSPDPFRLPRDPKRPAIIMILDDFDRAVGPEGFHAASIRRAIRSAAAIAVVSCAPVPSVYASVATIAAAGRRNTLLVETRPDQEIAWANLIRELAPKTPLLMAVVRGGHA